MFRSILLASGMCAAILPVFPAFAQTPLAVHEDKIIDTVLSDGFGSAQGQWRTRTQVVFDPASQQLERRVYELFDRSQAPDLDFTWVADALAADKPGKITGAGRLIWRKAGAPAYDDSGVVSVYRGTMRNGRAEGQGLFATREGLSYDGQWQNGRAHGRGRLVLPNGEQYEGDFRNGFAEGAGLFTETTWERFDGTFRRGLRAGAGKTTLPSGLIYESHWVAGRETRNSTQVRIAQVGAAPAIGVTDDLKLGITMERRPRLPAEVTPKEVLLYAARSTPEGLVVEPDDKKMVNVWVGKGEIRASLNSTEVRSMFWIEESFVQPAAFKLDFQNKASQPVEIQSMTLVVRESETENKPAIELRDNFDPGCSSTYNTEFSLNNYGWSPAKGGKIRFNFVPGDSSATPAKLPYTLDVGDLAASKELTFDRQVAQNGSNVKLLKSMAEDYKSFPCEGDKKQCLKQQQANPVFGTLGPLLRLQGHLLYARLQGVYEYNWTDAKGRTMPNSQPIGLNFTMGMLPNQAECGAGGPPEAVRGKPIKLRLDAENYTIAIPFRRAISPGRTANFTLALEADKSSRHAFEIVAKLADGRDIKSPPIKLLYYKPRPIPIN